MLVNVQEKLKNRQRWPKVRSTMSEVYKWSAWSPGVVPVGKSLSTLRLLFYISQFD